MQGFLRCILVCTLVAGCAEDGEPTAPVDAGNPSDQCVGDADVALLDPYRADGGAGFTSDLDDLVRPCFQTSCADLLLSNAPDAELEACLDGCFVEVGLGDLTDGCQDCLVHASLCAANECAIPCLGMDQDLCHDCLAATCLPQRDWCTGL